MAKKLTALALAFLLIVSIPVSALAGDLPYDDGRRDIINNVGGLNPANPQSPELNELLDDIMAQLIDEEMDYFEQLKACYDYVVENTRYGSHLSHLDARVGDTTCRAIYRQYGEVEGFGAVALAANVGMCNAYASAFIMMARKIGYDAYLVRGSTKSGGGGYAYHEWCEIDIDGTRYVFDPQLDQSLARAGLKKYMVFGVTYDQIPGRYILK